MFDYKFSSAQNGHIVMLQHGRRYYSRYGGYGKVEQTIC